MSLLLFAEWLGPSVGLLAVVRLRSLVRSGMPRADRCAGCDYLLEGLPRGAICPECGRRTDMVDPRARGRFDAKATWLLVAAAGIAALDFVLGEAVWSGKAALTVLGLCSPAIVGICLWSALAAVPRSWRQRVRLAVLLTALIAAAPVTWQLPRTQGNFHHRWRMTESLEAYGEWWIAASLVDSLRVGCIGLIAGPALVRAAMRREHQNAEPGEAGSLTPQ